MFSFIPKLYDVIFAQPIVNLLVIFYQVFGFLKIPGAFGFSIISLTIFIRLILHPFFHQQMQTAKKMQDLKPHLDRLTAKHKGDPKMLQQEQLKLYKQAGINPASGCLFMIVQFPVFIALYQTLILFLKDNSSKAIVEISKHLYSFVKISSINPTFFGFNLAQTPQKAAIWYYYLIPFLTAFLQYYQVKVSTPATQPALAEIKKDDQNPQEKKQGEQGDFQKAMNTQMKFIFPLLIGWFSFSLPVGLSIYWNVFSLFSIIQYGRINSNPPAGGQSSNIK